MRIIVCGGRTFSDHGKHRRGSPEWQRAEQERIFIYNTLDKIRANEANGNLTIIEGGARGADRTAAGYARIVYCGLEEYPADWERHGPSAGRIRNKQMIDEGRPDMVVAFPGGKGTRTMINQAKKAGIPVKEMKYE